MIKKYLPSPILAIAVVCFLLAGISFFSQKPKVTQLPTTNTTTSKPTTVLSAETTQAPNKVIEKTNSQPATPYPTQTTQTTTTTTTTSSSSQSTNPQVSITVAEPDGTSNFTIDYHDGMNACDSLTEAKNEGKIRSVTIDNSYESSLHSSYVKEVNGYSNNWTFRVNGQSPQGCSLYIMHEGDNIVWQYD